MPEIVDWHAHWVPPEVADLLAARRRPPLIADAGAGRRLYLAGGVSHPLNEPRHDIDQRLREMDQAGISRQVLSLAVVYGTWLAHLPADLELPIVNANNEGLAKLVASRGDRFSGLAVLPLGHLETAPGILERAMVEQGLIGAILPADAFADKPTARALSDVLAVADRYRAHLFIHPGVLPGRPPAAGGRDEAEVIRRRAVAFQDGLTAAMLTFEYTDFLTDFSGAVVHVANLGGSLPFLAERIAYTAERMGLPAERAIGRLRRTIVDTASFGPRGISLAAEVLGEDRLVFGTDSPALPIAPSRRGVEAAALSIAQMDGLLQGNALIPLTQPTIRPKY
jgi:predicted TIM-barrel fold metal-dependent hydrolase